MKVRHQITHEILLLEERPFAKGGEGGLYNIVSPITYRHLVAKIYHSNKRTKQRQHKLRYLIKNPPTFENKEQEQLISWPVALLEQGQSFSGFLMPKVEGESLEILATAKLPRFLSKKWQRFKLGTEGASKLREKVCFNIAVALYHIHQTGRYVMVDLKPDNILIQPNGLVSLVDMDSIEIVNGDKVLFPAAMATPEFAPPEFHQFQRDRKALPSSWDVFSMAVIFYKILLGIHPFAASTKGKYENANGLGEKLKYGLYVHNKKNQTFFSRIPTLHQGFYGFPTVLQYLFNLCFVHGIEKLSARPTAEDWCVVLGSEQREHKVLVEPLGDSDLQLYSPSTEMKKTQCLMSSFEDVFFKQIKNRQLEIVNKIKKEKRLLFFSIKKIWNRSGTSSKEEILLPENIQIFVSKLTIPKKWAAHFLAKIEQLYIAYELKQQSYKEQNTRYQKEKSITLEEWQFDRVVYLEQYHEFIKEYRKKCFEIRQNRNEQPIWKAFVGKTAEKKQAFLKQKYLPFQEQELEENYAQKIKAIDTFYQPKWELLEKTHYQKLEHIDQNTSTKKVLKKEKEEHRFVKQRQTIINAIQEEKENAKLNWVQQKKLLNFSVKNYIEQLDAIDRNVTNQIEAVEQSTVLRLIKLGDDLLVKKEAYDHTLLSRERAFKATIEQSIDALKKQAWELLNIKIEGLYDEAF